MSIDNLFAFAFGGTLGDAVPASYNYWVVQRLRAILGQNSEERAYQACRYIEQVSQSFDCYDFPKFLFDNGMRVDPVKSQAYSDTIISEGDYQLQKNSLSFALTGYSAGIASALEEDLGRAYSRRARGLFHAQRFEDCAVDVDQALKYRSQLCDIETSFLINMKKFCYHRMGKKDDYTMIDEYKLMNKWLVTAESKQQKTARLVEALELLMNMQRRLPSQLYALPDEMAHPGPCRILERGEMGTHLSTLPVGTCRVPTHMPSLSIEEGTYTFSECQWLMLDLKRRRLPKKAPVLEETNAENSCFSSAVSFYYDGTKEIAIAERDILAGELVAVEKPWASVVNPEEHCTFCDHCKQRCLTLIPCQHCSVAMFCDETCQTAAWTNHHGDECGVLRALLGTVRNWHRMEVATLALRMFFTFWRESNRSVDFMRFRMMDEEKWPIGTPSEQAALRTAKIHFESVPTTPLCGITSLKASLAAASLTHLLRQHSKVFNDPEGPASVVSLMSGPKKDVTTLRHSIQPSLLQTMDSKKFAFWTKLLEEDTARFYESGLAEALNFGYPVEEEHRAIHREELIKAVLDSMDPSNGSGDQKGQEVNTPNHLNEEGKIILQQICGTVPVALNNMSDGMKSLSDFGVLKDDVQDMPAVDGIVGQGASPSVSLAGGDGAHIIKLENVDFGSLHEAVPSQSQDSVPSLAQERTMWINKAIKILEKQICNLTDISARSSAEKTPDPVAGPSNVDNVRVNRRAEVNPPSIREIRAAVTKAWKGKTKDFILMENIPKEMYEIIVQNTGGKSSQAGAANVEQAGAANVEQDGAGCSKETGNTPQTKDLVPVGKSQENEKDLGEAVMEVHLFLDNKTKPGEIAGTKGPRIEVKPIAPCPGFPDPPGTANSESGTSEHTIQKMQEFVKKALEIMKSMKLCDEAYGNLSEEGTVKIFCSHLNLLMKDYMSSLEQRDASPSSGSVRDETCSTLSAVSGGRSDESDDDSYVTAESEPQDKAARKQRAEIRLSEKIRTFNDLKNLVDSQTMDALFASVLRYFRQVADAAGNPGTIPPIDNAGTIQPMGLGQPFQLTHDPLENKMDASGGELTGGFVRFVPRPKPFTYLKLTRHGKITDLLPDPFLFSLAFYDESQQPLSMLEDVSKVPTILVDRRVCAVRLPHLPKAPGSSLKKRLGSAAITVSMFHCEGLTVDMVWAERAVKVKWAQAVRGREMLAYSAAQIAKFSAARTFRRPALWDDLPLKKSGRGLFYTRHDVPVAAIDDFTDGYFMECFRDLGPRTNFPPVDTNFLFVGKMDRPMAAVVKNNFFHRLLPSKTVLNDPQGPGEATPWVSRRLRKLTPDDVYYNPTAALRRALLPWYYDFFEIIYEHRLRAVSCLLLRASGDHKAFLKGKITREMMEFRRRMMMPHPLLGRPLTVQETLPPPQLSAKLEERMSFVTSLMLGYYHLASKASRTMECTYSIDDTDEKECRAPRPTSHSSESSMSPQLAMSVGNIEFTMVGMDSYRPFGSAVYSTPSYLPHSCDPNVFGLTAEGDVGVWAAMRHIRKGEKLTVSYGPQCTLMKRFDRRCNMRKTFGMECECSACQERIEPRDSTVPLVELVCYYCDTQLGINKAKRKNPRTLICPKCRKRNDANHSVRRLAQIRRFVEHVRLSLYGRPSNCYNFLPQLGQDAAFVYDHVQRPNQLTFALEEVTKMALIQRVGNFYCVE